MKRLPAVLIFAATLLQAEPRAFTDQFGRSITAELISVEGDKARIRRDDGQVFTLETSKLSEADQTFIKEWAAKQPAPASAAKPEEKFVPDPKKLVVSHSRGKFSSQTLARFEGYTHAHEQWGYSIQITNEHLYPVEKLRVEYNLFARTFSDTTTPLLITGSKDIAAIPSRRFEVFRTGSAEVCKRRDIYFGNTMGEMRGIWYRVYVDGQLMIERSSPESLSQSEKWTKVKDE